MDTHDTEGYQIGPVTIWNCPACGRKVLVSPEGRTVMNEGDTNANHRGSMEMRVNYITQFLLDEFPRSAGWVEIVR